MPKSRASRPDDRKGQEAAAIRDSLNGLPFICFDERGSALPSDGMAHFIGQKRDGGLKGLALLIGGADGLDPALRQQAVAVWSFGAATMPHQIVRIVVAEQLYRAMTILAGHPYHRVDGESPFRDPWQTARPCARDFVRAVGFGPRWRFWHPALP